MSVTPTTRDAFDLLLQGSLTLARMEHHGLRVDTEYLTQALEDTGRRIGKLEAGLRKGEVWQAWERRFGGKAELWSAQQLGTVLFDVLGWQAAGRTGKSGQWRTDDEALTQLNQPWVQKYLKAKQLAKARSTYLEGLQREVVDSYVHPSFNLNTVETYRSSANMPSIQNQPARNEEMGEIIRRCYVPRSGHVLYEVDYGALEFRGAAMFWDDPAMKRFCDLDPHRETAVDIFRIPPEEVSKPARHVAKNQVVFPLLYGSWWKQCARNVWDDIAKRGLMTVSGRPLYDVLAEQGIAELGDAEPRDGPAKGTFEYRMKQVEDAFNERFAAFSRKKREWWELYQSRGWFDLLTGFRVRGHYSKNFLMNCPIQGPCFHLMLWSLTRIDRELRQRKLKTRLVAEIHDSLLADGPPEEAQEFLDLCERVMTKKVRRHWSWVTVPLIVEVDVAVDHWGDKKPWVKKSGVWQPKEQVPA